MVRLAAMLTSVLAVGALKLQEHLTVGKLKRTMTPMTIPPDVYTDNCVSIGQGPNGADVSAVAWVRTTASWGAIVARWKHAGGNKVWGIWQSGGKLIAWMSSTGTNEPSVTGSTVVNDGSWHMVGLVHDSTSSTTKLYVDGSLDGTGTTVGQLYSGSDEDVHLGAQEGCNGWVLSGDVGNVVLYQEVLTDSEMSAVATGTLPPYSAAGFWPHEFSSAGGGAAAVGDPHLQNVNGERFDLMKVGKHVLVNIPLGKSAEKALLRVQADARRLGGQCADIYFQEVNVTGSWAESKQAGGYHYSVSQTDVETPQWVAFGKVALKVVHGRTDSGLLYLNVYVKHLSQAGFAVGGLLGEDDHGDVIVPPETCIKHMALVDGVGGDLAAPSMHSVAVASLV